MSGDHNQHQKPTGKGSLQVEAEQDVDWEAIAAEQAMTIAMMKTEQAEEQEPVAWMFQHEETGRMNYVSNDGMHSPESFLSMNPRCKFVCALYTRLPQREWLGLTDEDIAEGAKQVWVNKQAFESAVWWADAKLKEKNT
jgi:hypothetical protein